MQKGVALTKLPQMFVFYAIRVNGKWQDFGKYHHVVGLPEHRIYNITGTDGTISFQAELDMTNLEESFKNLNEITARVELECPFAKSLGVSGVGEGVVWTCTGFGKEFWFKVKGEQHMVSNVTKYKPDVQTVENVNSFAKQVCLVTRLEQGLSYLKEMNLDHSNIKNMGTYIKWIVGDVIKEMDIDVALLKKKVSVIARSFYMNQ